jgi:hypothetical protein
LITLFTYNIKTALIRSKKVIMFIFNIQKAFNTLLKRQLLRRITKQGWPLFLLQLINSFLSDKQLYIRLEKETTKNY